MRFITQVLIFGFVAFCAASDEDALETPLKALIPRRFFEKLNNGWQRSLTALKVSLFWMRQYWNNMMTNRNTV